MRPSHPTRKRPSGTPSSAAQGFRGSGSGRKPPIQIEPEPDDDDLLAWRDTELDEVVAHLGRDGDQRVAVPSEPPFEPPERLGLRRPEVAAQDMAVKRVDDDFRPRRAGDPGGEPSDRAGLRRVRMEDVRTHAADHLQELPGGCEILERRDLPLQGRQIDGLDPELVGDVLHRPFAAADRARDESRLVTDLVELLRQVRDVERRPADIEAGNDAEDADRLRRHRKHSTRAVCKRLPGTDAQIR